MGHERYESTEVYLKVFTLDVTPQLGVAFSLDHRDYSHLLTQNRILMYYIGNSFRQCPLIT